MSPQSDEQADCKQPKAIPKLHSEGATKTGKTGSKQESIYDAFMRSVHWMPVFEPDNDPADPHVLLTIE